MLTAPEESHQHRHLPFSLLAAPRESASHTQPGSVAEGGTRSWFSSPSLGVIALTVQTLHTLAGGSGRGILQLGARRSSLEQGDGRERAAPGGLLTCRQRLSIRLPLLDGSSPHLEKPQADSNEMLTESGAGTGSLAAGKGLPAAPGSGQGELSLPLPFSAAPKQSKT